MTVTGCDDCPLMAEVVRRDTYLCQHPGRDGSRDVGDNILVGGGGGAPDWCPLRKGPLTIALEGGGVRFTHVQCDTCKTAVRVDQDGAVTDAPFSEAADAVNLNDWRGGE